MPTIQVFQTMCKSMRPPDILYETPWYSQWYPLIFSIWPSRSSTPSGLCTHSCFNILFFSFRTMIICFDAVLSTIHVLSVGQCECLIYFLKKRKITKLKNIVTLSKIIIFTSQIYMIVMNIWTSCKVPTIRMRMREREREREIERDFIFFESERDI